MLNLEKIKDILFTDELYLALVWSTKAHANIISVDTSEALTMPGVHSYISSADVPAANMMGPRFTPDEEVFATQKVIQQTHMAGI